MRYKYLLISVLLIATSCQRFTPEQKMLREVKNKNIKLDMFKTAYGKDSVFTLRQFRKQYDYISVVYLQNECGPCYRRYIDWHEKMDSINQFVNHTVLFVIQGLHVNDFLIEVDNIEPIENRFFIIMDPNYLFLDGNQSIPKWIFDRSVLIDRNNSVRMIGSPFYSNKHAREFKNICNGKV